MAALPEGKLDESIEKKVTKKSLGLFQFQTPVVWFNVITLLAYHVLLLYVLSKPHIWTFKYVLWQLLVSELGGLGITAGAHRLFTHRSYKAKWPLRAFLLACFYSTAQNKLYDWVRDHRVHHKFSDTDADPHSASRGLFFSHMGWLMLKKHPEVLKKGSAIDMSDIVSDPVIQFGEKYFWPIRILLSLVGPVVVPVIFFNMKLLDTLMLVLSMHLVGYHRIWSVNSFAHYYGYKPFDKSIYPAENRIVSFLALGEGWHNYHHVFPWDYRTAEISGPFLMNRTVFFIEMFAKLGWAYDLKKPSTEMIKKAIANRGDGSPARIFEISESKIN